MSGPPAASCQRQCRARSCRSCGRAGFACLPCSLPACHLPTLPVYLPPPPPPPMCPPALCRVLAAPLGRGSLQDRGYPPPARAHLRGPPQAHRGWVAGAGGSVVWGWVGLAGLLVLLVLLVLPMMQPPLLPPPQLRGCCRRCWPCGWVNPRQRTHAHALQYVASIWLCCVWRWVLRVQAAPMRCAFCGTIRPWQTAAMSQACTTTTRVGGHVWVGQGGPQQTRVNLSISKGGGARVGTSHRWRCRLWACFPTAAQTPPLLPACALHPVPLPPAPCPLPGCSLPRQLPHMPETCCGSSFSPSLYAPVCSPPSPAPPAASLDSYHTRLRKDDLASVVRLRWWVGRGQKQWAADSSPACRLEARG